MRETWRAIKVGSYRSAFAVVGISLSLISLFILTNLLALSFKIYREVWENVRFEVFPEEDPRGIINDLGLLGGIDKIELIDGRRAKEEFLKLYPNFKSIVEELGEDVFYTVIRVYPKEHWKDEGLLKLMHSKISALKGVSNVYYGESWIASAGVFFKTVLGLTLGVIFITIMAGILISFYTVRFAVSHRKTYIDILRLYGVSPFKLRYPYILLSIIYAFVSWLFAVGISLYLLDAFNIFRENLYANLTVFLVSLIMVILGSLFGSIVALKDVETLQA
jgi:cell division protein FtsX